MSSRASSISYADSIYEAKQAAAKHSEEPKTYVNPRSKLVPRRSSKDSTSSASASSSSSSTEKTESTKKQRHPLIESVKKAWKEHHESVNAAYETYYGMGVRS